MTTNDDRLARIKQGLGSNHEMAHILIGALRGCNKNDDIDKTFKLFPFENVGDYKGSADSWRCDCLEEAMEVEDLYGAESLTDNDRLKVLSDILVKKLWKEG